MKLNAKVSLFFAVIAASLIAVVVTINLYAFRTYSIASATEHLRTAAEIVRVDLTESMINGVIDKRESFLRRLMEVQGLSSARVVRAPMVMEQFGSGLKEEAPVDEIEREVLSTGIPQYRVMETKEDTSFRGTIPFIASSRGTPNCIQCHKVSEGTVLGAVTMVMSIGDLKQKAIWTVAGIVAVVLVFALVTYFLIRRVIRPITATAAEVEQAVQRALRGDFKAQLKGQTSDELGKIAMDMNRLLAFLDEGLNRIGNNVARLTNRVPGADENLLDATNGMIDSLTKAAHFKQAIEEDETKGEIHARLARMLGEEFHLREFSFYEVATDKNRMTPLFVDGHENDTCRWCDPLIMVRSEGCRARRTGHLVDGIANPGICYAFLPPEDAPDRKHVCIPIMLSGSVGNVLQLVAAPEEVARLPALIPFINVYLRETAPVLETKRLMETLRESSLRDPMTGLNNRRFLEEYAEPLVAGVHRRKAQIAILMLDLDHFKMVNDTHGHVAGDTVLKALAKVMRGAVRSSDMVIRYGGEEFLIILLDTAPEGADRIAESIRVAVEKMAIQIGSTTLKKTISIGASSFPSDSENFWQAVKFADVALYQAKEGGRNRVVRFTQEMWKNKEEY
ncbi:MAG: sensor domain-containing diguanylate cyclase [Alphaproteobacteria bacterium]|nr:sensor domain-containing diguanylate cyclase [Alphaproteobacteria bacterium]MBF0129559.1 sensor domain-containing diguanylate cyclase [Alphaproteobacteria bacterium]